MAQNNEPDESAALGEVPASIKAAAQAYKATMEENNNGPSPLATSMFQLQQQSAGDSSGDVVMSDGTPNRPASPAVLPSANTGTESPAPHRVSTPLRTTNGNADVISRATSQHPEPAPAQAFPKQAALHGAPTRQYLNGKVTTVLMEAMKQIAKDQPADPLRVLGEYLLQKSKELEGT